MLSSALSYCAILLACCAILVLPARAAPSPTERTAILERVLPAIKEVERPRTSADALAAFKREKAVGDYQIRPCMVDEANRIVGWRKFKAGSSPHIEAEAQAIFLTYSAHWCARTGDWSEEGIARRWNGGPTGHKKTATRAYWKKIKKALDKN